MSHTSYYISNMCNNCAIIVQYTFNICIIYVQYMSYICPIYVKYMFNKIQIFCIYICSNVSNIDQINVEKSNLHFPYA